MTVPTPADSPRGSTRDRYSTPYGWDWSNTTHEGRPGIVDDLLEAMGAWVCLSDKGRHGWSESVVAYDQGGYKLGAVFLGGGRDDVYVESTSAVADDVRSKVLALDPEARTARVDTRVDTLVPFEQIEAMMFEAACRYGTKLGQVQWFDTDKGTLTSTGRTTYLGAPSSAVRVRLYEKWLESPGQYVEGTNRVEVQLRPASKVKARVSAWTPAETFCASKTTRTLAELLGDDLAPKASLHVKKDTPDLQRSLRTMGEQYGGKFRQWMDISGGDLGTVLGFLAGQDDPE